MDSTGVTSGIESLAIRWSIADGGGEIWGVAVGADGVLGWGGAFSGEGLRFVALRRSINCLTVSDIFEGAGMTGAGMTGVGAGGLGMADVGLVDLGILANCGAESCGVENF